MQEPSHDKKLEIKRKACRKSFTYFVKEFWSTVPGAGQVKWNWHLDFLCDELQIVAERIFKGEPKEYDLVINLAPGTSKSTLFSILFPCWLWTRMAETRIITASNTDALVMDLSNKSRDVLRSQKYKELFPEIEFTISQDAKSHFRNTKGGERETCTVAGKSPIGRHALVILIDDPLDPKEALSEVKVESARHFMTEVIPSRVVDKLVTPIILIMQRLGLNDPTDVMLKESKKEGAFPVRHICLPAELEMGDDGSFLDSWVEPKELASRYIDGLMDPVRLGRRVLDSFRARGNLYYHTQFLQRPYAKEGGMFEPDWFGPQTRVKAAPYDASRVLYIDRACLVGKTLIETDKGSKKIEDICSGDFVLTREGYKEVEWAGETKRVNNLVSVLFSNGSVVTGTPDHKIWTENKHWIELSTVDRSCYTIGLNSNYFCGERQWVDKEKKAVKVLCSMDLLTVDQEGSDILRRCDGILSEKSIGLIPYTERSGDFTMVTFPLAIKFITKTKTGTTTRLKILNASLLKSMPLDILKKFGIKALFTTRNISKRLRNSWQSGGMKKNMSRLSVNHVERNSRHVIQIIPPYCSVPRFVESVLERKLKKRNVQYVVPCILDVDILAQQSVLTNFGMQRVQNVERSLRRGDIRKFVVQKNVKLFDSIEKGIPVYDITVKECHEFFANGILVHNSVEDSSACRTAMVLMSKKDGWYYVEHCLAGRWEPGTRNKKIRGMCQRLRDRYGPNFEPTVWIEAEGGATGKDANIFMAQYLSGFSFHFEVVTGSKDVRAEPWASQLEAGNVKIVEDDSWSIDDFVSEHLSFMPNYSTKRLGRKKDVVDSAAGAFRMLQKARTKVGFRVVQGEPRKGKIRLIACSKKELSEVVIEDRAILVLFSSPEPDNKVELSSSVDDKEVSSVDSGEEVMCSEEPEKDLLRRSGHLGQSGNVDWEGLELNPQPTPPLSPYGLGNLLDKIEIKFTNLQPSDFQENWEKIVEPWGKSASELVMKPEHGKKFWGFMAKHRDPLPYIYVIADDGDGRALSAAYGMCDVMRLPRKTTVYSLGEDQKNHENEQPPNKHVYETIRKCRNMVI